MTQPSEPLISRNYAIFLVSVAALVVAVPFIDRKNWQGWAASVVGIAAIGTMSAMWLYRTSQNVLDWWRDDL
jgi:hypothetical protein